MLQLLTVSAFVEAAEAAARRADGVSDTTSHIGWAWRDEERVWR
jgi:hypothetical protein